MIRMQGKKLWVVFCITDGATAINFIKEIVPEIGLVKTRSLLEEPE
jgi:hypothetical protein